MGMGDAVPGISGGTIAVITGIYEELIASIGKIDFTAITLVFSAQIGKFWSHINGNFLGVLALGVLFGLLISANSVLYLLEYFFEALMSFFIGLVLASTYFLKAEFHLRSLQNGIALMTGIGLVVLIAVLPQQVASISLVSLFCYGAVAICAMILPGLSGAFLLLMLGVYEVILSALTEFQLGYIAAFAAGCGFGLLAFARLLNWVLGNHRELSYSFLTGMLVGSVMTLWPWQQAVSTVAPNAAGSQMTSALLVSPFEYLRLTGNDPQLVAAGLSFLAGVIAVVLVHSAAGKSNQQKAIVS
jgi:putative membrane protein